MNLENPIRLVRELKGAPLSILFALSVVHQRVSQAWLERATGYTDKPISQALAYLQEINFVDCTSAGWQLTGEAKQLPLPLEIEPPDPPLPNPPHPTDGEGEEENSDESCQGRKVSESVIIINDSDFKEDEINNNNNKLPLSRNFSDSEVFEALTRAKIVGKKRISLSESEWVTVESVENWEEYLKHEKGADYKPGLLITYLESGAPAPEPVELDEFGQPKKDYIGSMIRAGLYCEFCRQPVQDCECEVEE